MTKHGLTPAERLWARVDKSGDCWIWTGARRYGGYGQLAVNRPGEPKRLRATHRLAWELTNGPIPVGLYVCHRCDNPPCCNPTHLFLGTHLDNMADMVAKQRHSFPRHAGAGHPCARLTEDQVASIRERRSSGELLRVLAAEFGIGTSQVWRISQGESWRAAA